MSGNKCKRIQSMLLEYHENGLGLDDRSFVEGHIRSCQSCADVSAQTHALLSNLRLAYSAGPPDGYWETIVPRVRERLHRRSGWLLPAWIPRVAAPLAAAMILAIAVLHFAAEPEGQVTSVQSALAGLQPEAVESITELHIGTDLLGITATSVDEGRDGIDDQQILNALVREDSSLAVLDTFDELGVLESFDETDIDELLLTLKQQPSLN